MSLLDPQSYSAYPQNNPTDLDTELNDLARGLYMDGWHATAPEYDGKEVIDAVANLKAIIARETSKLAKAYGGCIVCYGKGYATTADGTIGYDDFGGEGFKSPITTKMKFCTCGRGKQLEGLLKAEAAQKGEV